jgi:phage FluMu gp28-like protein
VEKCVDSNLEYELNPSGDVAGFDVGRRRDLSVVIVIRRTEDNKKVIIGKAIWSGVPFEEQQARALEIAKRVGLFYIDQGGMGEAPAEWLKTRSPNVVPILFNDQIKTEMFLGLKRLFEQGLIRIPLDVRLMQSLSMIRRYYRLGRVIIDAERTDELGHADEATALALACYEPPVEEAFLMPDPFL